MAQQKHNLKKVWRTYIWPALSFLLMLCVLPIILPALMVMRIYRKTLYAHLENSEKEGRSIAKSTDAMWFQSTEKNLPIINMVMRLEGTATIEELRKHMGERLVFHKDENGKLVMPKWSSVCVRYLRRYVWVRDEKFDIAAHVREVEDKVPKSHEEMMTLLGHLCSWPLTADKPHWEMILIPAVYDKDQSFYVLFRVHHGIGDGVSLMKAFMRCVVDVCPPAPAIRRFGTKNQTWKILKAIFEAPSLIIHQLFMPFDRHILHGPRLSGDKLIVMSEQLDLEMIKRMKNAADCTVNDVLMACLAAAFSDYMHRHASRVPNEIYASVPIDLRNPKQGLVVDNQFSLVFLPLPLKESSPMGFLQETKRRMNTIKGSGEPLINMGLMTYLMARLPNFASKILFDQLTDKCSMVVSNVPGPSNKLHIAGRGVQDMCFFPPQRASVGMAVSILSYNGHVKMGLILDRMLCTHPQELVDLFQYKVYELAALLNASEESSA